MKQGQLFRQCKTKSGAGKIFSFGRKGSISAKQKWNFIRRYTRPLIGNYCIEITALSFRLSATLIVPPEGVNLKAFDSRFKQYGIGLSRVNPCLNGIIRNFIYVADSFPLRKMVEVSAYFPEKGRIVHLLNPECHFVVLYFSEIQQLIYQS
jgi:hypothetical protein